MVGRVPFTSDALAATIDGRVVAVGGIAVIGGIPTAFLDLDEAVRSVPVLMHKTALAVLAKAKAAGRRRVFAAYDPDDDRAIRWLIRLGFRPVEGVKQAVMQWQV